MHIKLLVCLTFHGISRRAYRGRWGVVGVSCERQKSQRENIVEIMCLRHVGLCFWNT